MPVTTKHPEYEQHEQEWLLMEHSLQGEQAIKGAKTRYLPKTSGQIEAESLAKKGDSIGLTYDEARAIYDGYILRATYPLWVKDALRTMMGLVGRQEPEISLPGPMKIMETEATADGFGLKQLFMRAVSALLTKGRMPLLADFDSANNPYIAAYTAETAINWKESDVGGRQDLILAVLEEQRSKDQGDEFGHDTTTVYRVFDLVDGKCRVRLLDESGAAVEEEAFIGTVAGSQVKALEFIPLVFVGSTDNSPAVDEIPLLTMAKAALKYYQLSADYFTSLHYTAHPQPWVSGLDEKADLRVTGPMAAWTLPENGQAGYLEFTGAGVAATQVAMTDQRNAALEAGARVIDVAGAESGEARRARQDDQHASLYSVVTTAAEGIEQLLKYIAYWMGLNPDDVVFQVVPKFTREQVDAAMMQIISNMVMAGHLPREVLFGAARKAQITELTDEQLAARLAGGDFDPDADVDADTGIGGGDE